MLKKILILLLLVNVAWAQSPSFEQVSVSIEEKLQASIDELNALREQATREKLPLSQRLNQLEDELSKTRIEYQQVSRLLDSRTLDIANLNTEIRSRKEQSAYLSNLLSEYIRNFESRLHIAELQKYNDILQDAKMAPENSNLNELQVYQIQCELVTRALRRLDELFAGTTFTGRAVDSTGLLKGGKFLMVGPAVIFTSQDEKVIGPVRQQLGSLEPSIVAYGNEIDTKAALAAVQSGKGMLPLDPTLGNAFVVESTNETLMEHIQKGGPVMIPILAMAGAALLVALYKWICLTFTRKPAKKRLAKMVDAIATNDNAEALRQASLIGGLTGKMLVNGIEHIDEPVELIEEVMFENVLSTRLKLQRWLPFIAICAASAPLLGLLGTVTGIINTFKLITVFGSGDVKMLSGGISEALITTKFGLIVAIPSLLLHAFLSRKAKSIIDEMEKAAVALINKISKTKNHKKSA